MRRFEYDCSWVIVGLKGVEVSQCVSKPSRDLLSGKPPRVPLGGQEGSEHALSHLSAILVGSRWQKEKPSDQSRASCARQCLLRLIPQRDFDRAISSL